MRWIVASILLLGTLAFTALGLAASSFTDAAGDNNEAPDVTAVTVSQAPGTTTVTVAVANYPTLPAGTWFNLWFDLDSNPGTGADGDEALIRYLADGTLEFYRWSGSDLVPGELGAMTAAYANGVLTITAPSASFADASAFGVLAVASHGQEVEGSGYTAADFAPDTGRSAYAGPASASFADPQGDNPAAPDVTTVRVADAKSGMVTFTIATPNYATLPEDTIVLLLIDSDLKQSTGASGADLLVAYGAGEVELGRWDRTQQQFVADEPPSRVQARNAAGVLTIQVHRSELGNVTQLGFAVGAAHIDEAGGFDALDVAPETSFWRYALVNKPQLRLVAGKPAASPARPAAGKSFSVSVPVTRSDSGKPITTGSATCTVKVGGVAVRAAGRVAGGRARCTFRLPAGSAGKRVTGSVVVRSGGTTVTVRFAYTVR